MHFIRKIIKVGDIKQSYWDNGVNSKYTLVLFPSGCHTGEYFKPLIKGLIKDIRIIAIDYPGRGRSDDLREFDNFELIASYSTSLIKNLNIFNPTLLGVSFGTAVINEIVKSGKLKIKKVILIAPGEFFSRFTKRFLLLLFKPTINHKTLKRIYFKFFSNVVPIFKSPYAENKKILSIDEQWISTLKYKLRFKHPTPTKAYLILLRNDNIINPNSLIKLKRFYKNNTSCTFDIPHLLSIGDFEKKILPFINNTY